MSGLSRDLLGPKGLAVQFNYSFHNLKKNPSFVSSFFFVNDGYYSAQGYPTAQVKTALWICCVCTAAFVLMNCTQQEQHQSLGAWS